MYILDTNVVSELRKAAAGKADQNVVTWAKSVPTAQLYLSVISVLELETGVLRVERRDAKQGAVLRSWLETHVWPAFADRILDMDKSVSITCAQLHVPDPRSDRDAIIAATGLVHGMSVVTRNVDDFAPTNVTIINPWEFI